MSVKMECDNCHTQVTTEGMGNHGWILINQQLMFNQLGEMPITGSFCTVSCAREWLAGKDPTAGEVTLREGMQEEMFDQAVKAAQETLADAQWEAASLSQKDHGAQPRYTYDEGFSKNFSGKAGEILDKVWGTGEPIAIFRARDLLSIFPLQAYAEALDKYGAHYDQQESWGQVREDFRAWQNAHAQNVRLPD